MIVVGLSWQWVVFGLRLGWVHTLRCISYASLYDRFSYSSLCRSSHFVHTLTGILALAAMQRQPSNTIYFGLSLWLLQSSQPHPSNIIRIRVWCPWSLCGLGWVSLWVGLGVFIGLCYGIGVTLEAIKSICPPGGD